MIPSKEKELFEWLLENVYNDLVMSLSPISRWDCYSPSTSHRIELKCRKKHYDDLILERKKYEAMIFKCDDNLDIPMYINSTPEGIFRFNLYLVSPEWFSKNLRATTEFANKKWVSKEIAMLDVKDAEIL